jgi:hypothetical protein
MLEDKTRSELFGEVIRQLDSAAGEARETGPESLADYIEETLIPFAEGEQLEAALGELAR